MKSLQGFFDKFKFPDKLYVVCDTSGEFHVYHTLQECYGWTSSGYQLKVAEFKLSKTGHLDVSMKLVEE